MLVPASEDASNAREEIVAKAGTVEDDVSHLGRRRSVIFLSDSAAASQHRLIDSTYSPDAAINLLVFVR